MALYINSNYIKIKSKSKTGCEQLLAVIGGYFYSILALSAPLVIVSLLLLFIPVSSNVAVSACSTLQANTHSGRGQMLDHYYSHLFMLFLSLIYPTS
jgi:hypothetical protein